MRLGVVSCYGVLNKRTASWLVSESGGEDWGLKRFGVTDVSYRIGRNFVRAR